MSMGHLVIFWLTLPQMKEPQTDTVQIKPGKHFCSAVDRAVHCHNHLITGQVRFPLHPQPFPSLFRSSATQTFIWNSVFEKSAATARSKRKENRNTIV